LGLLAFAVTAVVAALKSVDFATALSRAILAAVVMCLVGYVAGAIAERAVREAVDKRLPLHPEPTVENLKAETGNTKEVDK